VGINTKFTVKFADPENPTLEPNRKWIGWLVAEIQPFKFLPGRLLQEQRSVVSRSVISQFSILHWSHILLFATLRTKRAWNKKA